MEPPARSRPAPDPRLDDPGWLRARYETDFLSTGQIAVLSGANRPAVRRALTRHGVPLRLGAPTLPALRDPGWLRARYYTDSLAVTEIAGLAGCSISAVEAAINRHRIPRRPRRNDGVVLPALRDPDWLRARYRTDGLSQTRIAALAGCATSAVGIALRRYNIPIRPVPGPDRTGPDRAAPAPADPGTVPREALNDPGWLRARYETDKFAATVIARMTGTTNHTVARALRRARITIRPANATPALLRDPDWLRARYETDGLTQKQIAVLTGCSRVTVQAAINRHAIHGRTGTDRTRPHLNGERLPDPVRR